VTNIPNELRSLDALRAAAGEDRRACLAWIAGRLGADYACVEEGSATSLPRFKHQGSGVELVVVPGGSFEMGFTDEDGRALERALNGRSFPESDRFVSFARGALRPIRKVAVSPFLLGRFVLSRELLETLSKRRVLSDAIRRGELGAIAGAMPFRLPAEAELEWVAREGGATSFVCRLDEHAQQRARVDTSILVNAWGIDALLQGEWAADDWHDTYEDAPSDARPWMDGDPRGVFRGALPMGLDRPSALVYALACYRGRGPSADDDDEGGEGEYFVRPAVSLVG
jgi:formylglycine-generating enzyme required for sulfatase activity